MSCADCAMSAPPNAGWLRVVVDPELAAVPCESGGGEYAHGEACIVESPDGQFLGKVTCFAPPVMRPPRRTAARVLRRATDDDIERALSLAVQEREMVAYLKRRVRELSLDIRPLKVRLPIVGRKAVVFFTAEQRVDFRPLVRELAKRFRRRIEMRPLGVRDGAMEAGGLGPCGRHQCCVTFMERFHSVTVRMAKRQNLSLNPTKISGMCGRLMCCLAHEVDQYPNSQGRR
jgi:cell fate regulator YaaT (PSP1 superfamily)